LRPYTAVNSEAAYYGSGHRSSVRLVRTGSQLEEKAITGYQISLNEGQVKELLIGDEGLKGLVESMLNEVLEAQLTEHISAGRYERSEERSTHRNGYRARRITCRVGKFTLHVPQTRDGAFSTDLFRRYQRSEQALVLAMMEMVLKGVSTRKVTAVTGKLCGESFSKSTVSRLSTELDVRMRAWNERSLEGKSYPFLMGDSASEASWDDMFTGLTERGLCGVDFLVSDAHKGMVNALTHRFQVHLQRNVLGLTPRHLRGTVGDGLRRIFRAAEAGEDHSAFQDLAGRLDGRAERAIEVLEDGLTDALAVLELPDKYQPAASDDQHA